MLEKALRGAVRMAGVRAVTVVLCLQTTTMTTPLTVDFHPNYILVTFPGKRTAEKVSLSTPPPPLSLSVSDGGLTQVLWAHCGVCG